MDIIEAAVLQNAEIAPDVFDMTVTAPEGFAPAIKPGQFMEIYVGLADCLLPRPISVCAAEADTIRFVYQRAGRGTNYFSERRAGDTLRMLGPCGNGFSPEAADHFWLAGGGVGAPPLLLLARSIREAFPAAKITAVLGFRSKGFLLLTEDFNKCCDRVFVTTDDGSEGFHGSAVAFLKQFGWHGKNVYACGPRPMLKSLADLCQATGADCQVSMEERMACGIGACIGCAVKIKTAGGDAYQKVCTDGPVFRGRDVVWEEET